MKSVLPLLWGWILVSGCAISGKNGLQSRILDVLEHPETRYFYDTTAIPKALISKIRKISESGHIYNEEFSMANPGEDFNSGCVRKEQQLTRRLVFVAQRSGEYVLCYERGGRAHNLLVSFSHIRGRRSTYYNISLRGIPERAYSNLDSIQSGIREGRYLVTYNNGRKTVRQFVPF